MSDEQPYERTIVVSHKRAVAQAESAQDLAHYLVVVEGADAGRRFEIAAAPLTIGRDAGQAVVLADTEVSRRHARISLVAGAVIAEDLGSTNGTFVDSERLASPVALRDGSQLRVGSHTLRYEHRSRRDVEQADEIRRDLQKASSYVSALLPPPLADGPVRTDWRFLPSAQLGGDAFGYYWLDPTTFVFYLLDVSGHGVGAAMHSVTILNVLRQRALPNVDFRDPGAVLASLNDRFPMDSHGGMYFTMWYGVYELPGRVLRYASAGHHPAYVVGSDRRQPEPLGMSALMLGAMPDCVYQTQRTILPDGCVVYMFSDGVFEVVVGNGQRWTLSDFVPLLAKPAVPGVAEAERLFKCVTESAARDGIDDDFSLVTLAFA